MSFDPASFGLSLMQYMVLLFSLCFHEAAHAYIANRRGDPTARLLGRMTLNPVAHIDPIGTVALPILMIFTQVPFLFGWAKPVPFNPRNLHDMRRDSALISFAGPASNIFLALISLLLLKGVVMVSGIAPDLQVLNILFIILLSMVMLNFLLALFNLIPVPPLDGSGLLAPILPPGVMRSFEQIGPFGIVIAIVVANRILPIPLNWLKEMVLAFIMWGQG